MPLANVVREKGGTTLRHKLSDYLRIQREVGEARRSENGETGRLLALGYTPEQAVQ